MPFTLSHAVVALPFARTPLVPAAIAIGAMTPDLPLFVRRVGLSYGVTHSWSWLPATVLLAAGLLLVWRCLLRPAARELAPVWLGRRLPSSWDGGASAALRETLPSGRGTLWLAASLLVGVVSHIVWDSFTHEARAGVEAVPLLAEDWGPLAGYKWLQHASSVAGLVVLAVWAFVWLRRRRAEASVSRVLPAGVRWAWWASLPVILAVAWIGGLAAWGPFTAAFTPAHLGYRVLPPACAVWGVVTLVLAFLVQGLRSARNRGERRRGQPRHSGGSAPHARGGANRAGAPE